MRRLMDELLRLGTMKLDEAKSLQRVLAQEGVELVLDHNDHTCTRGCSVTVELLVAPEGLPIVQRVMKAQFEGLSEGNDVRWELLQEVFDPNQEVATCPACGTKFSTVSKTCPGCGLCF